ncbi:MAG: flagellar protein FliS [Planctomycetota bacterium]|nr:MAG: flagellar protein FliS [Planctomycetota bacterium]
MPAIVHFQEDAPKMLAHDDDINPYLRQEVLSASPVRLRWMLIRRAEELCGLVEQFWDQGEDRQAAQWLLRIREILGELLDGITGGDNPLARTVADFYVFLLKLCYQAERDRDAERLRTLRELLAIESETWQMVIRKMEVGEFSDAESSVPLPPTDQPSAFSGGDSLSLEI